ncbi:hypothetical protein HY500_00485 [Candidatus Woesearchaeota archaeon]|nr:hypothetical protein [Candidatus Woesearchaeota archaeon]
MYILGISCYFHDASAALLKDGVIVAAAEEERFTRKKHDASFPMHAINYCLQSQNITVHDLTYIGFYEKPLLKFERLLSQHLHAFPWSFKTFLQSMPSWLHEKLNITRAIRKQLKYSGDILFIEHHLAHAASAFLLSPFKKAAIVTIDGVGSWTTTSYGIGNETKIHLMKVLPFPHSLGLLYSTLTAYLGFDVNDGEYKVMGLSAYGLSDKNKNIFYEKLKNAIDIKDDGSYHLDMSYFQYHYSDRMPSQKLCKLLGGPARNTDERITQRHKDIAAAAQMITEDVVMKILHHLHTSTECEAVVLGGGVALNSVCNGKILKKNLFKKIWIPPAPGDSGASIGAAAYIYHSILGHRRVSSLRHAFLGPGYSRKAIKNLLEKQRITFREFKNVRELVNHVATLIYKDNVVGWFQGRMEIGPRALGNRSILANPCNPHMKTLLNHRVKHRESFRPFAPAVCMEDASHYFHSDSPLPPSTDFMAFVYPAQKKWRGKIPAVLHVDGSGRLQSVRREYNPLFYNLIRSFENISGFPLLLNTSFNVSGEPLVCSPSDALQCFQRTKIDYLIIDRFLIGKKDNLYKRKHV